jgi:hypothetical protein
MTAIPPELQFSQGSLQDYADCPRRFQLRYLQQVAWPALESEPVQEAEREMRQGARFHRLVQQHLLGIPAQQIERTVSDPDLARWWQAYLAHIPAQLVGTPFPELSLSMPFCNTRLVAQYDLVLVQPGGKMRIYDWKTSRRHRPGRRWLSARLQTRVYPYLLAQAGAHLNGGQPVHPEQVEMIYWFAEYPDQPEHFLYDTAQHQRSAILLEGLVAEIRARQDEIFPLTSAEARCRFCTYRSLCGRGTSAGQLEEDAAEERPELELDFENIDEIAF